MAKLNKKAFFMSLISVFIILIFVLSSEITTEQFLGQNLISSTETRVAVLNDLVNDLEDRYFERMLYVAGRNALIGLAEYKANTDYLAELPVGFNLKSDFSDVVLRGLILDNITYPFISNRFGDTVPDYEDNCIGIKNENQSRSISNNESIGDACMYFCNDYDSDGVCDHKDNCPRIRNPDQKDIDRDGVGDMCENVCVNQPDSDNDGICDSKDKCSSYFDPYNFDKNNEGGGDACDVSCTGFPNTCVDNDAYAPLRDILDLSGKPFEYSSEWSMFALFQHLEEQTKMLGLRIIYLEIDKNSLVLEHSDAWTVKVIANFKYYFQDENQVASWKGEKQVEVYIPIEGIKNPFSYYDNCGGYGEAEKINRANWEIAPYDIKKPGSFLERLLLNEPDFGGSQTLSICRVSCNYPKAGGVPGETILCE